MKYTAKYSNTFHRMIMTALLAALLFVQGCQKKTPVLPAESETQALQETSTPELEAKSKADPTSIDPQSEANSQADFSSIAPEETVINQALPLTVAPAKSVTVSAPLSSIPSPSTSGKLHVEGANLWGSDGKPVQLKGISTHGLAWFPDYINEDCFAQFRTQWDVNVMRLAMYTAEYNGYCSGGDQNYLKSLVKKGVTYATEHDLYVIIDWHILSDSNPNEHIKEAGAFFDEMAKEYAGHNNVLYEICNEPNGGTSWSDIKTYASAIIGIIRSHDPDAVIIVGTPNWSQYVDEAAKDPITGAGNLMYALHFYAATHKDDLRNRMVTAIQAGLPVFVTEYGICDASGNGSIDRAEADKWVDLMNQYQVSYVAWNLSNKAETSAILNSSCTKTSNFSESDLSESGVWLYHMLTGKRLPATSASGTSAPGSSASGTSASSASGSPAPGAQSQNQTQPASNSHISSDSQVSSDISVTDGAFEIKGTLVNQWSDNGQRVCQYSLTIRNTSGTDCTTWAVELPFPDGFTLENGWNGDYHAGQNTLRITAKDYNRSLPAGGTVSDVGFIVRFK